MGTKVTRLEDLSDELRTEMLTLADNEDYEIDFCKWELLYDCGLVDTNDGIGDILTERGQALVNDYNERHTNRGAASLKDFDEAEPQTVASIEREALLRTEKRIRELEAALRQIVVVSAKKFITTTMENRFDELLKAGDDIRNVALEALKGKDAQS